MLPLQGLGPFLFTYLPTLSPIPKLGKSLLRSMSFLLVLIKARGISGEPIGMLTSGAATLLFWDYELRLPWVGLKFCSGIYIGIK